MNEHFLIEQIHGAFEIGLVDEVQHLRKAQRLLSYKPDDMNAQQYMETIEHFSLYYPSHNFVTEKQIREICLKYNLVMGASMFFTGDIPPHNQRVIDTFELRKSDARSSTDIDRFMYKKLRGALRMSNSFSNRPDTVYDIAYEVDSDVKSIGNIMPIGDGLVMVCTPGNMSTVNIYAKVDSFDSEWLVDLGEYGVDEINLRMTQTVRDNGFEMFWATQYGRTRISDSKMRLRVEMQLSNSHLRNIENTNLNKHCQFHVVAPGTMFGNHKESVEIQDDYKLRFKQDPTSRPASFSSFLPDPIVLQPVIGGYLVVTKWGLEATLPEIQNEATN